MTKQISYDHDEIPKELYERVVFWKVASQKLSTSVSTSVLPTLLELTSFLEQSHKSTEENSDKFQDNQTLIIKDC